MYLSITTMKNDHQQLLWHEKTKKIYRQIVELFLQQCIRFLGGRSRILNGKGINQKRGRIFSHHWIGYIQRTPNNWLIETAEHFIDLHRQWTRHHITFLVYRFNLPPPPSCWHENDPVLCESFVARNFWMLKTMHAQHDSWDPECRCTQYATE